MARGKLKVLCEWKRQQPASCPPSLLFARLIDGYKSPPRRPDSQFREFDLVKDTASLPRSPRPASISFSRSACHIWKNSVTSPPPPSPPMKFVLNYSISSLVLITFPFSLNLCHISQGLFLLFSPARLFLKMLFHYQKVLSGAL